MLGLSNSFKGPTDELNADRELREEASSQRGKHASPHHHHDSAHFSVCVFLYPVGIPGKTFCGIGNAPFPLFGPLCVKPHCGVVAG